MRSGNLKLKKSGLRPAFGQEDRMTITMIVVLAVVLLALIASLGWAAFIAEKSKRPEK
jgi:hypothetical protein